MCHDHFCMKMCLIVFNALKEVQKAAILNKNIFEELMNASKTCSLGQITNCLFEVGGQYRRNM